MQALGAAVCIVGAIDEMSSLLHDGNAPHDARATLLLIRGTRSAMSKHPRDERLGVDALVQDFSQPIRSGWIGVSSTMRSRGTERRSADRIGLVANDVAMLMDDQPISIVDLSASGVQFRCGNRLAPGSTVMLRVRWRSDPRTSLALGRVVWSIYESAGSLPSAWYRVGAVFEQFDIKTFRQVAQRYGVGVQPAALDVVGHRW